MIADRAGHV